MAINLNSVVGVQGPAGQILYASTGQTQTSVASYQDLHSYTMPANTLGTDGDELHFKGSVESNNFSSGPGAWRILLGSTTVASKTGITADTNWNFDFTIQRRGATSQYVHGFWMSNNGTVFSQIHFPITENLATSLDIKFQAYGAPGVPEEMRCQVFTVSYLPA